MPYSCYVRHEGRDLVEVQPTVTIRFDQLTAITRNRFRRVLQDNYNPYGWSAKSSVMLVAMRGHYEVFNSLLAPALMDHPDFDQDMFRAKALLIGYEFKIYTSTYSHMHGRGILMIKSAARHSDGILQQKRKQMDQLTRDTLLPIARSLIDHKRLAPIMDALENRQPYTFAGVNMR